MCIGCAQHSYVSSDSGPEERDRVATITCGGIEMKTKSIKIALARLLLALMVLAAPVVWQVGNPIGNPTPAHPMDGWDPPSVPL